MVWNPISEVDTRIVGKSGWRDLDNYETLEERAGVYIFANADLHVKYIGKAGPHRMVDEIYSAINRGKSYGATKVKALYTNSDEKAKTLERELIIAYNPPNNLI